MVLFRKVRSRLIKLEKFKTYLIYALGEILLIVIGLLIAWKINDINESRKNRIRKKKTNLIKEKTTIKKKPLTKKKK